MIDDDPRMIKLLVSEDHKTIKEVYKRFYPKAIGMVKKLGGDENEGKDIMQLSIIDLISNLKQNKYKSNSKLESYFLSIVKFKWFDRVKKIQRERTINIDEMKHPTEDSKDIESSDTENIIRTELLNLKQDCYRILRMFYFEKKSMKDIALAMKYTDSFVRVKKNRCMAAFKKNLLTIPEIKIKYPNAGE